MKIQFKQIPYIFWIMICMLFILGMFMGCQQTVIQEQTKLPTPTENIPSPTAAASPSMPFPTIPAPTPDLRVATPVSQSLTFASLENISLAQAEKAASITIMGAAEPLFWERGWCAHSAEALAANLLEMKFRFSINGAELPRDVFLQEERSTAEKEEFCIYYTALLSDLQRGKYELIEEITIEDALFDGQETFSAGINENRFLVYTTGYDVMDNGDYSQWVDLAADEDFAWWDAQEIQDEWMKANLETAASELTISIEEVYKKSVLRLPPLLKVLSSPVYFELGFSSREQDPEQCYGLYADYQYAPLSFIEFSVCGDNEFSIEIYENEQWESLVERQQMNVMQQNGVNRLAILMDKQQAKFFINGEVVSEVKREPLARGYMGAWVNAIAGSEIRIKQPRLMVP